VNEVLGNVVFFVLAAFMIGGAIAMLSSRNVVHAAYWLLSVSAAAAGLFALLNAGYVALMQVLIYAGAVAILNIFTIMITMRRREDAVRESDFSWPGLALAVAFFGLVVLALLGDTLPAAVSVSQYPGLAEFGQLLFSPDGWALPFEIASLILTSALVAAVWWSKEDDS
jgi:NADH-quinone oxidoreductase subunit J